jgi:hypothetical protein
VVSLGVWSVVKLAHSDASCLSALSGTNSFQALAALVPIGE